MNNPLENDFICCPYNKSHRVLRSRIQQHILKCKETSGVILSVCPYDATHRMPQEEFYEHVINCTAKVVPIASGPKSMGNIREPTPDIRKPWFRDI